MEASLPGLAVRTRSRSAGSAGTRGRGSAAFMGRSEDIAMEGEAGSFHARGLSSWLLEAKRDFGPGETREDRVRVSGALGPEEGGLRSCRRD